MGDVTQASLKLFPTPGIQMLRLQAYTNTPSYQKKFISIFCSVGYKKCQGCDEDLMVLAERDSRGDTAHEMLVASMHK